MIEMLNRSYLITFFLIFLRKVIERTHSTCTRTPVSKSALELLLGSKISVMAALSLPAVGGLWWKSGIALSANHLFALVLPCQGSEIGLNFDGTLSTSSQAQHQVKSGLLLDVVV